MKKITITLIVIMILVVLAACGPDYTEAYNAVVDKYNADVDKYDATVESFDVALNDIMDADVFTTELEKLKSVDEEVLSNTKAYLDEIRGYEEGISDKENYQLTISNMEDTIETLGSELASIPQIKEFYNAGLEFYNLSEQWEAAFTPKSEELSTATDVEALNATIEELIIINDDFIGQVQDIIAQVKAIDNEEYASDIAGMIADMEEAITTIEGVNNDLEGMKQ